MGEKSIWRCHEGQSSVARSQVRESKGSLFGVVVGRIPLVSATLEDPHPENSSRIILHGGHVLPRRLKDEREELKVAV